MTKLLHPIPSVKCSPASVQKGALSAQKDDAATKARRPSHHQRLLHCGVNPDCDEKPDCGAALK